MIAKKPEELEALREGGRRLARILGTLAKEVRPGMTTKEIDERALALIRAGGDAPVLLNYTPPFAEQPYPASICVSVNDEIVHGIPSSKRALRDGDIVGLDLAIGHKGLIVDAAVTVPVGAADAKALRLIASVKEALSAGVKAARAGNRIGDVSHAIESVFARYRFETPPTLGGHGVGKRVHEEPEIPNIGEPGAGPLLKAGMVLAIEPMANEGTGEDTVDADGYTVRTADGKRSAHFEHTILVTDGEPEILTKL